MIKCDFNKIALQLYWNHTSTWVFSYTVADNWHMIFFKFYFVYFLSWFFVLIFFHFFIVFILLLFSFCFQFVLFFSFCSFSLLNFYNKFFPFTFIFIFFISICFLKWKQMKMKWPIVDIAPKISPDDRGPTYTSAAATC